MDNVKIVLKESSDEDTNLFESIVVEVPDIEGNERSVEIDAGPMYDFVVREILN